MRSCLALAIAVAVGIVGGCAPQPSTPRKAPSPMPTPQPNGLEAEIASIVARYEPPEWRCSQYMFDMQDLARGADARVPEVLDLVECGVYSSEVRFMLYLTGGHATGIRSALQDLATRTDGVARERAQSALDAVERGIAERQTCREGTPGRRTMRCS